jgi:hypothetical protein
MCTHQSYHRKKKTDFEIEYASTGDRGGGGGSSSVTTEVTKTVKSSTASIPMETGRSRNVVVKRTVTGSGDSVEKIPFSISGQLDDLEQQLSTGSTTMNNLSREVRTVTSSSSSNRPTDFGDSCGRNIVVETRTTSSGHSGGGSVSRDISGSSGETVENVTEGLGGTQMRVVRHIETSYVGDQPVNKTSNVIVRESEAQQVNKGVQDMTSTGQSSFTTMSSGASNLMQNIENNNQGETVEYSESVHPRGKGRRVVITEPRIERRLTGGDSGESTVTTTTTESSDSNGTLRSIMKQRGNELGDGKMKKEISFSEDVIGG